MRLERAVLMLSTILLVTGPVFANLSRIVCQQVSGTSVFGTTEIDITTNFDASISASISKNGVLPGSYSVMLSPASVGAGDNPILTSARAINIPSHYFVDYAGVSDLQIATVALKIRPSGTDVPAGGTYDVLAYGLGEIHIDGSWPTISDDLFIPLIFGELPVVVSFPAAPVPLPGAALLGVLGLGYAGIRLRRV